MIQLLHFVKSVFEMIRLNEVTITRTGDIFSTKEMDEQACYINHVFRGIKL